MNIHQSSLWWVFPFQKKINQWLGVAPMFFCFFPEMVNPFSRWWWHHPFWFSTALQGFGGSVKGHSTGITASKMPEIYTWLLSLPKLQVLSQAWGAGGERWREATYQTRRRRSFLVTPLPIYGKCPIKGRDISGWWNPPEYHHESKINKRHRLEDVFFVTFWWQATEI